jgi:hypothetical protein
LGLSSNDSAAEITPDSAAEITPDSAAEIGEAKPKANDSEGEPDEWRHQRR